MAKHTPGRDDKDDKDRNDFGDPDRPGGPPLGGQGGYGGSDPGQPDPPGRPAPKGGVEPKDGEEPPPPPVLTALLPAFATIGDPNFALRVIGSGFTPESIIVFAGQDEPVTFLSPGDMTTGVNMALWQGPDPAIPVTVRNLDGQESNELTFEFKAAPVVEATPPDPSRPSPAIDQI